MEAKDATEIKTFIQRSVWGSDKMRLTIFRIFRAGLSPSQHGSRFFEVFGKGKRYIMSYYTTSSSSNARLAPLLSSGVPKLTLSTLIVQPKFANSKTWLLQKQTPSGSPPGPITLTLHRGENADEDFWALTRRSSGFYRRSRRGVWSTKELGPMAVAHKTTRHLMKRQ